MTDKGAVAGERAVTDDGLKQENIGLDVCTLLESKLCLCLCKSFPVPLCPVQGTSCILMRQQQTLM